MNVIIVGLMGSGKSTVGRLAAQKLGFEFVDTDQIIVEHTGRRIPLIFEEEGESGFRKWETEALLSLANRQGLVIATGGGIVTQPRNLPILRGLGYVVWLNAEPATLHRRTMHSHDRPLLLNARPEETLRALHEARHPMYEAVAHLKIQTDDLAVEDVAYGVAESAKSHFHQH